jgi:hypothetical protein
MGIKQFKVYKELDLEEGKVYKTKFSTGEFFQIVRIVRLKESIIGLEGIYLSHPHVGVCPLSKERLVPEKVLINEIQVCDTCATPLEYYKDKLYIPKR